MWKKSTYSGADGCVEVDLSLSAPAGIDLDANAVVEFTEDGVHVWRQGNPDVRLLFTFEEWDAFVLGVRDGEFDLEES